MPSSVSNWSPPKDRHEIVPLIDECFHPARSMAQADLFRLSGEAAGWVLKDFSHRPLPIRLLMTRRILRREVRALEALGDIEGIPHVAGCVGRDAFVLERLNAERLPHLGKEHNLTPELFDRLQALVDEMHQRGWAHGDLRRKNILYDPATNTPCLIDFATAVYGGPGALFLLRWFFGTWCRVDNITLARIKESYLPDAMSESDRHLLANLPVYLRLGRFLKKKVYRPFKRRHRKRFWDKIRSRLGRGKRSASSDD